MKKKPFAVGDVTTKILESENSFVETATNYGQQPLPSFTMETEYHLKATFLPSRAVDPVLYKTKSKAVTTFLARRIANPISAATLTDEPSEFAFVELEGTVDAIRLPSEEQDSTNNWNVKKWDLVRRYTIRQIVEDFIENACSGNLPDLRDLGKAKVSYSKWMQKHCAALNISMKAIIKKHKVEGKDELLISVPVNDLAPLELSLHFATPSAVWLTPKFQQLREVSAHATIRKIIETEMRVVTAASRVSP